MGKLHLKRTPEEEAERQQRKRRRKEKWEAKKSRYTNHPSSPTRGTSASRKWASDDEDNDGDIHGPPPLASTTSTSKRDTPDDQHRYKPDYDAIRAQLEEERFRERMFSAFDDDERLDSLETRFNDYAHVPDRWRNDVSGSRGQLNVGEDDFLQMDPQFMDDEEYAEWVRLGMYRKTHRDEYEEQQREKARKKERKEKEKAAKAEAARLEKEMELERSRRKREKEYMRLDAAKELYESEWVALLRKDRELETEVAFEDIPWPLLSAYPRAKKRRRDAASPEPVSLDDFTADAIAHFVLASPTVVGPSPTAPDQDKKERKEKLRDTMLRFHPDKFEGRVMGRVKEGDKERVRQAVGQVARLLNDLMGDMS